jgi:nitrogen fixation NifU-like protein
MGLGVQSYTSKPPPVNEIQTKSETLRAMLHKFMTMLCAAIHRIPAILSPMFSDKLLDHFRNPRNVGDLSNSSATVQVSNPVCGDVLRLSVRAEAGRIVEARFKTQGCVASIAASSVLTELLAGKTVVEARCISAEQISELLDGLPPATFHAAQLCIDAVSALLTKLAP